MRTLKTSIRNEFKDLSSIKIIDFDFDFDVDIDIDIDIDFDFDVDLNFDFEFRVGCNDSIVIGTVPQLRDTSVWREAFCADSHKSESFAPPQNSSQAQFS